MNNNKKNGITVKHVSVVLSSQLSRVVVVGIDADRMCQACNGVWLPLEVLKVNLHVVMFAVVFPG